MNKAVHHITVCILITLLSLIFKTDLVAQVTDSIVMPSAPEDSIVTRKINLGVAMALSAILPGMGKTYIDGQGIKWLLGVGGYGLIAGSVLLNHSAYNNLEKYRESTDPEERDDLYNTAQGQAVFSYVFAGGAIAIWAYDLITTGIKAGKVKKNQERIKVVSGTDERNGVKFVGLGILF